MGFETIENQDENINTYHNTVSYMGVGLRDVFQVPPTLRKPTFQEKNNSFYYFFNVFLVIFQFFC